MNYIIRNTTVSPQLSAEWNSPAWVCAETTEVSSFRPESSVHRPQTLVRLLHDNDGLHGIFKVRDQFVRCIRTNYFDEVWKDSCVELFLEPKEGRGYFNFEFNCGGAHLCCYITDPERAPGGFKEFIKLPAEIGQTIQVRSSLPKTVEPEIKEPLEWTLQFFIPFAVMEQFVGDIGEKNGQLWRGNFFKCAEELSHPHWASWSPVDEFNFHLPRCFGSIQFD
ncbi:MAG: hypothetical protein JWM68_425 [Verrucomicrobiales bacterium]|nr:hypothetical protein [Verrucomicrobiales bacterium]